MPTFDTKKERTLDEFIGWLLGKPAGYMFCQSTRINDCPVAQFQGEPAYISELTGWRHDFVERFDGRDLDHRGKRVPHASLDDAIGIARMMKEHGHVRG